MLKKIAVFTGTRAEYGLLFWLLKAIQDKPDCELQLIVSGSHLSPEFGSTWQQIISDGFEVAAKVEILLSSDSAVGVAKAMGLGCIGFADALDRLQPNVLIILGDRFEALAAAQVAMVMKIPIAHLHGGETTEGAYDDAIRHSITQMATWHFTAAEPYRQKVLSFGKPEHSVFCVGAIGLDHVEHTPLLSLSELAITLNFTLQSPFFLVTYHPVTLGNEPPTLTFFNILEALNQFPNHQVIFCYPNADNGGREIIAQIDNYVANYPKKAVAVPSLGTQRYLSAVKFSDVVIGNSSSGIIEVPLFDVPTVDIGCRQKGRLHSNSTFHSLPDKDSIVLAINQALTFKSTRLKAISPYGGGNVSSKVLQTLIKMIDKEQNHV